MSDVQLQILTCAVFLVTQLGPVFWVLVCRGGIWPMLTVNCVFAAGLLWSVAAYVPSEATFAWSDPDSDWFDYKNTILTVFAAATLLASLLAFRGLRVAKIVAWFGFAGNFGLTLPPWCSRSRLSSSAADIFKGSAYGEGHVTQTIWYHGANPYRFNVTDQPRTGLRCL